MGWIYCQVCLLILPINSILTGDKEVGSSYTVLYICIRMDLIVNAYINI